MFCVIPGLRKSRIYIFLAVSFLPIYSDFNKKCISYRVKHLSDIYLSIEKGVHCIVFGILTLISSLKKIIFK